MSPVVTIIACAGLAAVYAFPAMIHAFWYYRNLPLTLSDLRRPHAERLAATSLPTFKIAEFADKVLKDGECVLLFRQAEYGFYGKGCYLSHLDPRLLELYTTRSISVARNLLAKYRIRYILTPGYSLPEIYNSIVELLLADYRFAEVIKEIDSYRLYELTQSPSTVESLREINLQSEDFRSAAGESDLAAKDGVLYSGIGDLPLPPLLTESGAFLIDNNGIPSAADRVLIEVILTGDGYVEVFLKRYTHRRKLASSVHAPDKWLWGGVIHGERTTRTQLLEAPGSSDPFRIVVKLASHGKVRVTSAKLVSLSRNSSHGDAFERQLAAIEGWTSYIDERSPVTWPWGKRIGETGAVEYFLWSPGGVTATLRSPPVGLVADPWGRRTDRAIETRFSLASDHPVAVYLEWLQPVTPSILDRFGALLRVQLSSSRDYKQLLELDTGRPRPLYLALSRKLLVTAADTPNARRAFQFSVPLVEAPRKAAAVQVVFAPRDVGGRDPLHLTIAGFSLKLASPDGHAARRAARLGQSGHEARDR